MGMKFLVPLLLFFAISAMPSLHAESPTLQPQSPDTPQCEEKCLTACQNHCKLDCVYKCKCPKEKAGGAQCWADCVEPCHSTCEGKECVASICTQQCQKKPS